MYSSTCVLDVLADLLISCRTRARYELNNILANLRIHSNTTVLAESIIDIIWTCEHSSFRDIWRLKATRTTQLAGMKGVTVKEIHEEYGIQGED